jgi:hypothetical protein
MARVQLIIPDEDRDRFVHQARREGMTLSAWLRSAARQRLEEQQRSDPFKSSEDLDKVLPRVRRVGRSKGGIGMGRTPGRHQRIA